jgi:hypothetical protein
VNTVRRARSRADDQHILDGPGGLEPTINLLVTVLADDPSPGADLALGGYVVLRRDQQIKEGLRSFAEPVLPRPFHQQTPVISDRSTSRMDFSDDHAAGVVIVPVHVDQVLEAQTLIERVWADVKDPGRAFITPETSEADGWREREKMRRRDRTRLEHGYLLGCVPGDHDPGHVRTPISDQVLANREARRNVVKTILSETKERQPFIRRVK